MICSRECRNDFSFFAFFLAIVFGVLVGFLFSIGLLTQIQYFIWIALVIAVILGIIILIYLLIFTAQEDICRSRFKCICKYGLGITIGIILTIILAMIALSIPVVITTEFAILVGLLAFFFALAIAFVVLFVLCLLEHAFVNSSRCCNPESPNNIANESINQIPCSCGSRNNNTRFF